MNNGKICVPVTGKTAGEMLENIAAASEYADIIELRIDSLAPQEIDPFFEKLEQTPAPKPFLITFRPREQGGYREITYRERCEFWASGNDDFWGGDHEEDLVDEEVMALWLGEHRIFSFHDFEGVPENLLAKYKWLGYYDPHMVKIAVRTDDISDGLPLWELLRKAKPGGFIPIAMGEAGKWTRIMGPAFGAPLTYASLDADSETAPGQITAKDLTEIYRVKDLTPQTKVYGVIGTPVSKSLSPFMHNPAFRAAGIDAVFMHLEVKDLKRFIEEFIPQSGLNFGGLSVTMPHKQAIIPYLSGVEESAKAIGAVNTVKIEDGKLYGFNTDAEGFIAPLKQAYGELKRARVALFGAGGAARACAYALKKEGAKVTVFVRNLEKGRAFAEEFSIELVQFPIEELAGFDIAVNATPIGMGTGEEDVMPFSAYQLDVTLVYDLITKPAETALLREAKNAGLKTIGGAEMLIAQGLRQFEIWTGRDAPAELMREKVLERLFS